MFETAPKGNKVSDKNILNLTYPKHVEETIAAKIEELRAERKRRKIKHLLEPEEYRRLAIAALGLSTEQASQSDAA
jgi:hypothetical protein